VPPERVTFNSGATFGLNLCIAALSKIRPQQIITSTYEHNSVARAHDASEWQARRAFLEARPDPPGRRGNESPEDLHAWGEPTQSEIIIEHLVHPGVDIRALYEKPQAQNQLRDRV